MKRFLSICGVIIIAALILVLIQCSKKKTSGPASTHKWTVLAYCDGNNSMDTSLTGASYTITDIQEMERVGSSDNVNIIVMLSCLKKPGISSYYHIEKYPNDSGDSISSTILHDFKTKNMSDLTTLQNFIGYGVSKYPADHYVLIIDDHGGGWRGTCSDEQNGGGKMMTLPQLRQALTGAPKFDVIVFHAPLMSMVEVAYELRQNANYMVGSQLTIPMQSILGPDIWLDYLTKNPTTSDDALAASIVDAIQTAATNKGKTFHAASINLSKIDNMEEKVSKLALDLPNAAAGNWDQVFDAWNKTWTETIDNPDFVDLYRFAVNLSAEDSLKDNSIIINDTDSLIEAILEAVPKTKTNATSVTRGGISIWFPWKTSQLTPDSTDYVELDFQSSQWQNFLSVFVHSLLQSVTGSLAINSIPAGAEIYVDSVDQLTQTPDTIGDLLAGFHTIKLTKESFDDWDSTVQVEAGIITTVTAFLKPSGASVSGTVDYPGHTLSSYTYAYADTLDQSLAPHVMDSAQVDSSNGSYTIQITQITSDMWIMIEAWDDANNNKIRDAGDGWGFHEEKIDSIWDANDIIIVSPGQHPIGIKITLYPVIESSPKKVFKTNR